MNYAIKTLLFLNEETESSLLITATTDERKHSAGPQTNSCAKTVQNYNPADPVSKGTLKHLSGVLETSVPFQKTPDMGLRWETSVTSI